MDRALQIFAQRDRHPSDPAADIQHPVGGLEAAELGEVAEELGITATAVSLIGLYPFTQKNQLLIAYHVVAEGRIVLNEELAEVRLIEPGRLKAWDFGTGFAVADWLLARAAV